MQYIAIQYKFLRLCLCILLQPARECAVSRVPSDEVGHLLRAAATGVEGSHPTLGRLPQREDANQVHPPCCHRALH